ncbi:hypothetical protein HDU76_007112, partial [Blyttiomyces sp. JEL0837]
MTLGSLLTQAFTVTPWWTPDKIGNLNGKIALVTGGTTGLGKITCIELARHGATVYLIGRNPERTVAAKEAIKKESGSNNVHSIIGDLMDLKSISKAADDFLNLTKGVCHILVNNAGIMAVPYEKSVQGIEAQFATNHFAHVVLTTKLIPALIEGGKSSLGPSRIVVLSSLAHTLVSKNINCDELLFKPEDDEKEKTAYQAWVRYAETKLVNIYFANALAKKLADKNVLVNS